MLFCSTGVRDLVIASGAMELNIAAKPRMSQSRCVEATGSKVHYELGTRQHTRAEYLCIRVQHRQVRVKEAENYVSYDHIFKVAGLPNQFHCGEESGKPQPVQAFCGRGKLGLGLVVTLARYEPGNLG